MTPRFELFFRDVASLKRAHGSLIGRIGRSNVRLGVNVPNKSREDEIARWVDALLELDASLDVCPHYSVKNNYHRDARACALGVGAFAKKMCDRGIRRVLLVSGSGGRVNDAVDALERLAKEREWRRDVVEEKGFRFGVAFNPYFEDAVEAKRERERLERKLASGLVGGVWMQIGSDADALEAGIASVRALDPDVEMYGSVFLPSKQLLARMKFRPWAGVFLSEKYLGSVEAAEEITRQQLDVFARHGVTPLIESPINSDADWDQCHRLLGYRTGTKRGRDAEETTCA